MKNTYQVTRFHTSDSNASAVEYGLTFQQAVSKASKLAEETAKEFNSKVIYSKPARWEIRMNGWGIAYYVEKEN